MIEELKTDYKDDVLATSQQGKRTFNIVGKNGEILFEDVHIEDTSRYLQVGDEYGGEVINETNEYVNQMDDKLDELIEFMDNGVKAEDVTYNDSNVKLALDSMISSQNKDMPHYKLPNQTSIINGIKYAFNNYSESKTYKGLHFTFLNSSISCWYSGEIHGEATNCWGFIHGRDGTAYVFVWFTSNTNPNVIMLKQNSSDDVLSTFTTGLGSDVITCYANITIKRDSQNKKCDIHLSLGISTVNPISGNYKMFSLAPILSLLGASTISWNGHQSRAVCTLGTYDKVTYDGITGLQVTQSSNNTFLFARVYTESGRMGGWGSENASASSSTTALYSPGKHFDIDIWGASYT